MGVCVSFFVLARAVLQTPEKFCLPKTWQASPLGYLTPHFWSAPLQGPVPLLQLPSDTVASSVPAMHPGLHCCPSWVCCLFLVALALFLGTVTPGRHYLCHFLMTVPEVSHGAHHWCTETSRGETQRPCLKTRGERLSSLFSYTFWYGSCGRVHKAPCCAVFRFIAIIIWVCPSGFLFT